MSARARTRSRVLVALLAAALLGGCSGERPTRIVLITIDTLRYDSFAGVPGFPPSMPHTLAFAARGQVFEACFAATSATQPTHATIFTGLHPWRHGVTRNGLVLGEAFESLAEHLRDAGFSTAAVVASFPLHRRFGFSQGFDIYEEEFEIPTGSRKWEGELIDGRNFYSLAASVTGRAIARLDRAEGSRQFFWFHYFDPHSPYGDRQKMPLAFPRVLEMAKERPGKSRKWIARVRALYEGDVARLDRSLAQLFQRLDADADAFTTHVFFTADHGESFGEDGSLGHGERVTEGQVRVPCFVVSPSLEPAVRGDVAGSADVAATILGLAGLDPAAMPGRDLFGSPSDEVTSAFGMRRGYDWPHKARLVDGSSRVIEAPRFYAVIDGILWAGDTREIVLGDLEGAPAPPPQLARQLRALFGDFEADLLDATAEKDMDPETRRALEALGYVR